MVYMVSVFFLGIVLLMAFRLRGKDRQLECCKGELQEQKELVKSQQAMQAAEKEARWDQINAIHLYAALSAEEVRSHALREKQEAILRISEQLLKEMREGK